MSLNISIVNKSALRLTEKRKWNNLYQKVVELKEDEAIVITMSDGSIIDKRMIDRIRQGVRNIVISEKKDIEFSVKECLDKTGEKVLSITKK